MSFPWPIPLTPQRRHYASPIYLIYITFLTFMALATFSLVLYVLLVRTAPLKGGAKGIFWVNWAMMPFFVAGARISWNRRHYAQEGIRLEEEEDGAELRKEEEEAEDGLPRKRGEDELGRRRIDS